MARREKSKQDTLIDELLQDCHDPKDILGQNGLLKQLSKRLIERALQGELTDISATRPTPRRKAVKRTTAATARVAKRCKRIPARFRSKFLGIATAASTPNWSGSVSAGWTASMTRSWPCMRGG